MPGSSLRGLVGGYLAGAILAGCSFLSSFGPTPEPVSCSLTSVKGILAFQEGAMVLHEAALYGKVVDVQPVRWPAGWHVVVDADGATLVDGGGKLQGRAGSNVIVTAQSTDGTVLVENGVLIACPMDVYQEASPPPS